MLNLAFKALLTGVHLQRHTLEDARQTTQRIWPDGNLIQAVARKLVAFYGCGSVGNVPHLFEVFQFQIPQALAGQRSGQSRLEQGGIKGLGQVIGGAHPNAANHAVHLVYRRDHDNGNMTQIGILFDGT